MGNEQGSSWKRGDPIGYIRQQIPAFSVPAYRGERYLALAPDTLDLQERAALAVNVLTRATDPLADYEIYFDVFFKARPPRMEHNFSDSCQSKFMEALPLMRIISGSDLNTEVDRTDTVSIENGTYRLTRKGNEVVAIDPPGRYCPLYAREHYRQNKTRWREIERFVSQEQLYW